MPSAGRHYVGLSRLTAPENLFLFNFTADSVRTAPQVKAKMKRMREGCRVQVLAPNLTNNYPASLTLLAHNARSLHAHVAEVWNDINFQAADIILTQRSCSSVRFSRTLSSGWISIYACGCSTSSGRRCSLPSWDGHSHSRSS
jgi:hypothetical protein